MGPLESCSDKNTELNKNENNIQSKKETISKKIIHIKKTSDFDVMESFGEFNYELARYEEFEYDKAGNVIKETLFKDDKETIARVHTSAYNSYGDEIRYAYYYDANEPASSSGLYKYEYSEKDEILVKYRYDENGSLERAAKLEYNSSGNLIRKTGYSVDENNVWTENGSSTYDYDDKSREKSIFIYKKKEHVQSYFYEYDQRGNQISELWYSPADKLYENEVTEYDTKNNIVRKIRYGGNGEIIKVYNNEYDEKGRKVESSEGYTDSTITEFEKYEYNKNDDLILTVKFNFRKRFDEIEEYPVWKVKNEYEYYEN